MVTPFSYLGLFTMAITVNLFKSVQIHLFKASAFRNRLALGEAIGTQKTQTNRQKIQFLNKHTPCVCTAFTNNLIIEEAYTIHFSSEVLKKRTEECLRCKNINLIKRMADYWQINH